MSLEFDEFDGNYERTLSDERKVLREKYKHNYEISCILDLVEEQDKEAVKKLKEELWTEAGIDEVLKLKDVNKKINKIFGEDLI